MSKDIFHFPRLIFSVSPSVLLKFWFGFKVYLAVEAGYLEKVDELCDRYSLQGLPKARGIYCCTEPCLVFQNYTTLTVVFFILFRG